MIKNSVALEAQIGASRAKIVALSRTVDSLQGMIDHEDQRVQRRLADLRLVNPESPSLVGMDVTVASEPQDFARPAKTIQAELRLASFLSEQGFERLWASEVLTKPIAGVHELTLELWRRSPHGCCVVLRERVSEKEQVSYLFAELDTAGSLGQALGPDYEVLDGPLSYEELMTRVDDKDEIDLVVRMDLADAIEADNFAFLESWLDRLSKQVTNHESGLKSLRWSLVGVSPTATLHVRVQAGVEFDALEEKEDAADG